jgi:large subunit ribosomal protein L21
MEYAIIEIGGHQVWVEEGQYFLTNRILTNQGAYLLFNRILLVNKAGQSTFGHPYVENAGVTAQIIEHLRGPKVNVYKMKSKKKYRRKIGHRQDITRLLVTHIKS